MSRKRGNNIPDNDRDEQIQQLIDRAATLFKIPYDDRIQRDENAPSLKYVADEMGTTLLRARKFLIAAGMFSTELSRSVQEMDAAGMDLKQIMEHTGLKQASVYSYLPYKRGVYNLNERTPDSEQSARYRQRKYYIEKLKQILSEGEDAHWSVSLWETIIVFSYYNFKNEDGTKFSYYVPKEHAASAIEYNGETVDGYGNEIVIFEGSLRVGRATVDEYFMKMLSAVEKDSVTLIDANTESLTEKYLCTMFRRFLCS